MKLIANQLILHVMNHEQRGSKRSQRFLLIPPWVTLGWTPQLQRMLMTLFVLNILSRI